MVAQDGTDSDEEEGSDDTTQANHIHVLNLIASLKGNACKSLMHVMVRINGFTMKVFLDIGATNNFMAHQVVGTIRLLVTKDSSKIKVVNSQVQSIQGIATSVMKIGNWERE